VLAGAAKLLPDLSWGIAREIPEEVGMRELAMARVAFEERTAVSHQAVKLLRLL
jgi:hypothetical protein